MWVLGHCKVWGGGRWPRFSRAVQEFHKSGSNSHCALLSGAADGDVQEQTATFGLFFLNVAPLRAQEWAAPAGCSISKPLILGTKHLVIQLGLISNAALLQGPKALSYNPAENALLITSDQDGGSYELFIVPRDAGGRLDMTPPVRRSGWAALRVCVCVCQLCW